MLYGLYLTTWFSSQNSCHCIVILNKITKFLDFPLIFFQISNKVWVFFYIFLFPKYICIRAPNKRFNKNLRQFEFQAIIENSFRHFNEILQNHPGKCRYSKFIVLLIKKRFTFTVNIAQFNKYLIETRKNLKQSVNFTVCKHFCSKTIRSRENPWNSSNAEISFWSFQKRFKSKSFS